MKKSPKTDSKRTKPTKHLLYASAGLLAVIIVVSGFIYFSRPSTRTDSPISTATNMVPSTPNPANPRPDGSTATSDTSGTEKQTEVIQECDTPCRMDVGFDQMIDTGQKQVLVKFHGRDEWFTLSGRIDDRIPADFFSAGGAEFTSPKGEPSIHVQIKKVK